MDLATAQNLQEMRITNFDKMITGCRCVLQQCGKPKFLESLWELWTQLSQALYMMEKTLWPEQPPETPLQIALPQES